MSTSKSRLIAVLLIICGIVVFFIVRCGDNSKSDAPVRIGIAWRADVDSEFFSNAARAVREAGGEPVMLAQVRENDFSYDGILLSAACTDENDVLLQSLADVVKNDGWKNSNAAEVVGDVKAVILTGGEDIAPTLYKEPQPWHGIEEEKDFNATRDVSDYLTMTYCLDNNIPVLGLCRGSQMLGVVSGATVIQDIPVWYSSQGAEYDNTHRRVKVGDEYRDYASHSVTVKDTVSILYSIVGAKEAKGAPSWHHQAIGSVEGTPLKVTGYTTAAGLDIIEAIERTDKDFALGVQYHPEVVVTKNLDKASNAADYMSLEEAIAYFKRLIAAAK